MRNKILYYGCTDKYIKGGTRNMMRNQAEEMAQKAFREVLEEKVNQTLAAKLSGDFKAIVAPNGIHWATTYGAMSYCNPNTLKDVDRMVVFDDEGKAKFGDETFTGIYHDVLLNTSYQFGGAEKREIEELATKAALQQAALVKAYEEEVQNIQDEKRVMSEIIDFVDKNKDNENFSVLYPKFYAQYQTFWYNNKQYIAKLDREVDALRYIELLTKHLENPSAENGASQVSKDEYMAGYTLPEVSRIFNEISNENNMVSIMLQFSHFSQSESKLSIDHKAEFVVPAGIFVIGKSDTKYTLNSLTTECSEVSMSFKFKGITTFEASPTQISTDKKKGWYDNNVLRQIAENTGKDATGYYLQNKEFQIDELFGDEKRLNRLGEFVISQDPEIEIIITKYNENMVKSCFQHSSELAIDFFGFAISGSKHNYSVKDCKFDEELQSVTIRLSAPVPQISTEIEDKVGYLLGGVIVYPPEVK